MSVKNIRLQAFTLVEAILYTVLLSAIILIVGSFVNETIKSRNKQQAVITVEQEANYLLERIEADLKNAVAVSVPTAGATGSILTMTVNPGVSETHTFTQSGNNLTYAVNAAPAINLNSNRAQVVTFTVKHISPSAQYHTINIDLTVKYINPGNRGDLQYQKSFRKTVNLRPNL